MTSNLLVFTFATKKKHERFSVYPQLSFAWAGKLYRSKKVHVQKARGEKFVVTAIKKFTLRMT